MYENTMPKTKEERLEKANELIQLIAQSGLRFFNHTLMNYGAISSFGLDEDNRLYYHDGYTKKQLYYYDWYTDYDRKLISDMGITGPNVVVTLVKDLFTYIVQGIASNGHYQAIEYTSGWPVIQEESENWETFNQYSKEEKEAIINMQIDMGFRVDPILAKARDLFDDRYTLDYEEQEVVENATLLTETFLAEMYNRDATSLLDYVPYEVYDGSPGVKTYYVFEKENNHDLLLETESEEEYVNFVKSLFESLVDELTKKLEEK